jgi:hypothetical protein
MHYVVWDKEGGKPPLECNLPKANTLQPGNQVLAKSPSPCPALVEVFLAGVQVSVARIKDTSPPPSLWYLASLLLSSPAQRWARDDPLKKRAAAINNEVRACFVAHCALRVCMYKIPAPFAVCRVVRPPLPGPNKYRHSLPIITRQQ